MTNNKNILRVVSADEKHDDPNALCPPTGGEKYQTYSLRERSLHRPDFVPNWQAFWGRGRKGDQLAANPKRSERQAGKIEEAQDFRKWQGVYLEAKLNLFEVAQKKEFGLRWWFADHKRICLHHLIMRNYYLEDRPTTEEEVMARQFGSIRAMQQLLQFALEIGSLERDKLADDARKNCYYPSRGLVSDTDNLFNSTAPGAVGIFVYLRQAVGRVFGEKGYNLTRYFVDVNAFDALVDEVMLMEELPADNTGK